MKEVGGKEERKERDGGREREVQKRGEKKSRPCCQNFVFSLSGCTDQSTKRPIVMTLQSPPHPSHAREGGVA